ncbi:uncharacterized protein LOC119654387 isoform X2 [Hermetia illucens]|uniref:uncharacterized protein LOC119654387 isoform X2 n=1 Tax=Hermetia illucens TaxID=343691 RepID=UPI0018CC03FD|nr:uncharacterized protein LOC119654387 isoform X2 [Hermetia illucens]
MARISLRCLLIVTLCQWLVSAEKDFQFDSGVDDDLQIMLTESQKDVESLSPLHKNTYFKELSDCPYTESKIILSLVLKSNDWDDVLDNKKTRALNKLSKFFAVPKEFIKIESVSRRDIYEMSKRSIKRGSYKGDNGNKNLGKLEFMIGCGQSYFKVGEPISMQIAQQMQDGSIDDISGLEFGWWVIWKKKITNRVQRFKREEEEGSGQIDPDEDYDYDNYDDSDTSVTEVPVETTHPHRHHHGLEQPNYLDSNSKKLTESAQTLPIDTNTIETNTKHKKNELKPVPNSEDSDDDIKSNIGTESNNHKESDIKKTIENNKNQMETIKKETQFINNKISTNEPVLDLDEKIKQIESENVDIDDKDDEDEDEDDDIDIEDKNNEDYIIEDVVDETTKAAATTTTELPNIVSTISSSAANKVETVTIPTTTPKTTSLKETTSTTISSTVTTSLRTTVTEPTSVQSVFVTTVPTKTSGEDSTIPPYIEENVTNIPSTTTTSTTTTSIFASTVQSKSTIIDVTDTPTTTLISVINEKGEGGEVTTTTSRTATSIAEVEPESHAETTIVPLVETTVPHIAETSPTIPSTTPTTTTIPTTTSTTTTTTTTPKPTTTTTMEPSTEYIEPEPTNSPPLIKNRLPKQPVTAGKPFSFIVPSETFYDSEDGTNLRLELFDKAGNTLKPTSWIQFNPENKEIYGLPLEDSVSRWQFKMLATDSKNASVSETADIVVQQHKGHRSVNHEISIQVKLNEKFRSNVDWQIRLIRGIVETLNDDSMTNIVVREIRLNQTDPRYATFVYTNETLSRDTKCPEDRLDSLVERLEPSKLTKSLLPEISVKSVSGQPIGPCQKLPAVKPKPTPHMTKNFPPVPRNQVDRVNATINQLLVFKVPYDTFYDPEDHTDLKLSLLTSNRRPLDPRNWLQFDAKNQEFFGVPKYGDFGTDEYFLVAEDHEGLTANDALLVSVTPPARRDYSILTKLTLGMSYDAFNNAHTQRRFFERIAQIFGDTTTSNIQLKAIQNLNSTGNVMVSFFNTTMHKPHQRCPSDEDIETIRNVWQHSDSSVRDRVKKTLGSEFNLLNVHVTPTMCPTPMDNLPVDVVPKKTEEKKVSSFTDDYLFTFIVPAVIILVMLLLASIIACVLHRRRLTGKMELGDEEERRSFRSKGIPVIFQDELDEKPEIGNKSPIILKDEKPPLLPPSYNSDNDVDEYVPPPAVVVGGREQRGKSPVTPSYRRPPPYVSP